MWCIHQDPDHSFIVTNSNYCDQCSERDGRDWGDKLKACTHCISTRHGDRVCWQRLTCQKCGRKGHPSKQCLYVYVACGDIHENGKCPMEELFSLMRKCYVPTKLCGSFSYECRGYVKLGLSPGWNLARDESSGL